VGRANVVHHDALITALCNHKLGGAVLDVFDEEPVPQDSPLWDAPNLMMTPHIAAISRPELIAPVFIENYRRFVAGQALMNLISFEHGY
jgi:phosphoglycerate dehydrogenase-like enzyme